MVPTCVSQPTLACVFSDQVAACCVVLARVAGALIDILRAVLATETLAAVTHIPAKKRVRYK